ncbi:MAG: DUF3343 domain-containing protein [Oscillospiraceae bacterium]|jgi:hypothetical protein|nr:DUF3343 domain-containing protein [Oscillospiraceae bacterium]
MRNYFFICRSITYAQRTAKILEHVGIGAVVTRTPRAMLFDGCSYCVRVSHDNFTNALVALRDAGLPPARVFAQYDEPGAPGFREVCV